MYLLNQLSRKRKLESIKVKEKKKVGRRRQPKQGGEEWVKGGTERMRVKQLRSGNLREGSTLGVPRRGQWCLNPRVDQDGKDMQGRRGRGEGLLLRVQ